MKMWGSFMENVKKYIAWILVALILSMGLICSSSIVIKGIGKIKNEQKTITVTGSAKKQIKSDYIDWKCGLGTSANDIKTAYNELNSQLVQVKKFFKDKGVLEKEIIYEPSTLTTNYRMLDNGDTSNEVIGYSVNQGINIKSADVDRITNIYRESSELLSYGISFQSQNPEYYYRKLADMKLEMIGLATKNAKDRANQIAENTATKIGNLHSADVGVFQITPLYSTDASDSGISDTTSIDKEITAVVSCNFDIN
jgi:hypothetical protein